MDISMDVDFVVAMELSLVAFNIIKEICGVSDRSSLFQMKYENKIIYYF
jgi:hypothetical protein